jgi:hypothetical protein
MFWHLSSRASPVVTTHEGVAPCALARLMGLMHAQLLTWCHVGLSRAKPSGLKGAEVVVEIAPLPSGETAVEETGVTTKEIVANPIAVEQPTQEECQGATHRVSLGSELAKTNSEALNLAVVTDKFDTDTFDGNVDTEPHVEEDEAAISERDEENVQPSVDTALDAPIGTVDKGNEQNVPSSAATQCDVPTSSRIDWSSYYTEEELRALKMKLINLQDYPSNKDISHVEFAICDSAIVDDEGNPRVGEEVIKTGQLFESPDVVNFFFRTTLCITIDHTMWPNQIKTYGTS